MFRGPVEIFQGGASSFRLGTVTPPGADLFLPKTREMVRYFHHDIISNFQLHNCFDQREETGTSCLFFSS